MNAPPPGNEGRRALIATHYWPPHVGGVETVAVEQVERLSQRGWSIDVVTSRLGSPAVENFEGARIHRFRSLNWQEDALHVPVPIAGPTMLRSMLNLGRGASVIVAHGHAYVSSLYAGLAARRLGVPFVLIQHNPFVEYPRPIEAVERAVDATIGRWLLERATIVVCVSRFTESYVRSIAPRASTEVIYSGVDTDRFSPRSRPLASGPPTVLTLRRLVPRNGVDILVRAWREHNLGELGALTVAGDGPERSALEQAAKGDPSIRFRGRVPDAELADMYRSASIFVLPSVSGEGFGLVAAEALASGVPVVTTDSGATGELVRDGVDGLVVAHRDADALGVSLRRLLSDTALRELMATEASKRRDGLGWESSIELLDRCLTDVSRETSD